MKFHDEKKGDIVLLTLEGDMIGGPAAARLSEKLRDLCDHDMRKILVDMKQIEWMNSSGLGTLIASLTTIRNCGGGFKLLNLSEKVRELLVITKLDRVFEIFDDEGEATASFTEKGSGTDYLRDPVGRRVQWENR